MFPHGRLREPAGTNDAAEIAAEQRDAGSLHRDIGAGAHGDADFGGRQCRGVVDAVAAIATIRPAFCIFVTTALF